MKRTLSITLAVLTIGLLGSCSKINERLDNLEKKVSGIENEQIASINSQIDGIKTSIADLGTIRSDISSLKQSASDHSVDIFNLEEADRALKDRILNLEDYVDAVLPNYAEKEWVEATFSTLAQYEATCDTIAKIDARIGALDAKLSNDIKATADSLTKWVNKQFEGYYTAAQMDAKLAQMKSDIDSSKASGKISDAKADSIATELTNAKAAVDTAKANIRAEYRAAIDTAIKVSEGKLTKDLIDAITTVNGKIELLVTRVGNLAMAVADLTGRVNKLEGMIQSVTIVPAYSDGSLEDVEGGILTIDCIISPALAAKSLTKDYFKVLVSPVKDKQTKAVALDTAKVSDIKIGENGIVTIFAQAPAKPSTGAYAAALRIKDGANADYTTEFHTFGYSGKNVKVVEMKENDTEYKKVYIAPSEASEPKKGGEGKIPAKIDDKPTFDGNRPTVIEVVGIGTVTFDETAAAKINDNAAGADSIFFEVKDVTEGGKQEVVYQVLMKKATDQGEVFSVSNAAGEVTMEIPLADNVADVTKVTLLDGEGKPIDGGVVYGSIVYDWEKNIVTFKVNHFSRYAVGYLLKDGYKEVTGVSLDRTLELEKGASKTLSATITPSNATNKNIFWSSSDTTKVKVDTSGKVTAVALGTATVTVTTMSRNKTATCEVTVVKPKPFVEIAAKYNGSTTTTLKWYRQSLAITASGKKAWTGSSGSAVKIPGTDENVVVGDYFPWGTFAGFYGSGAGSDKGLLPYSAFTNKGCGDDSDGFTFKDDKQFKNDNTPYWSGSAYTKYNATDGRTTLEASDDVASIILGGTWRMPTKDELQAMKEATYWAWDATDKGYYVYAPNPATDAGKVNNGTGTYDKADALLFFPATGYGENTSMTSAGTYGYYRSSTLNSENTEHAYRLYFYYDGVNPNVYTYRYFGFSVRPVQDPDATYKAVSGVSFDVEKKEVVEGGNVQLSATVSPADATNKGVYWTSSDTTVAKVDALGKVTAVKAGTATITATTVDGTKTATCTVTVKKTMAEILKTATGIPTSQNLTPPANAWVNSTDPLCKAFVGIDAAGDKLFVIKKEGLSNPPAVCMNDEFEKIDDNTYKRTESDFTFTIKMTEGKFTSLEFNTNIEEIKFLNGTYSAPEVILPAGALKGEFSVSATKKVHFSKGNLQATYNSSASTYTWGFAANQYDCIGNAAGNTTIDSQTNGAVVDLFGWVGASSTAFTSSPEIYGVSTSTTDADYGNVAGEALKADWGTTIDNKGTWSTLTRDEWTYLFNNHSYKWATVNGVKGYVIAPDGFAGTLSDTYADDAALAAAGNLIFLPAAGGREGSSVSKVDDKGNYWSSTAKIALNAYYMDFSINGVFYLDEYSIRYYGRSVRLVTEASAAGDPGNGTEQYKNNSNPDWFSK